MNKAVSLPAAAGQRDLLKVQHVPEPGPDLRAQLRALEAEGADYFERYNARPGAVLVAEAQRILEPLGRVCAALARDSPDVVAVWLLELNKGQGRAATEGGLAVLLEAVLIASGDLPRAAFCRDTLAIALRDILALSSARIDKVVRAYGNDLLARRAALRAVVRAGSRAEPGQASEKPGPSERERILARFHEQMASLPPVRQPRSGRVREFLDQPPPRKPAEILASARARLARSKASGSPQSVAYFERVLAELEARYRDGGDAVAAAQRPDQMR